MKTITDPKKIDEILDRGIVVEVFPSKKEFREKLLSGKRLKLYIGFDATASALHLANRRSELCKVLDNDQVDFVHVKIHINHLLDNRIIGLF